MSDRQNVKLLTRPLNPKNPEYGGLAEVIVAVQVGDQRLELPMDSPVTVSVDAGSSTPVVTITLLADTVRFEQDPQWSGSYEGRQ